MIDDMSTFNEYDTPSQRMMVHGSIDRIHPRNIGSHHKNTKTKLLSTFLDLSMIESIKAINTSSNDTKIYL